MSQRGGMRAEPAKIVIVDDHPIVRVGFAGRLARHPDFMVCGEAGSTAEAVALVSQQQPDVVLLDISLRDGSGLELIRELKSCSPSSRIIVVSMYDDANHVQRALREGADGYVSKREAASTVIEAVETVLNGKLFLKVEVQSGQDLGSSDGAIPSEKLQELTRRELQTLRLIGEGRDAREIAESMGISIKTVDTYRANLREKLSIPDHRQLVQVAMIWLRNQQPRTASD